MGGEILAWGFDETLDPVCVSKSRVSLDVKANIIIIIIIIIWGIHLWNEKRFIVIVPEIYLILSVCRM